MRISDAAGWHGYGFAVLATGCGIGLKTALDAITGDAIAPFLPGFGALILTAWRAGAGPGALATFLVTAAAGASLCFHGTGPTDLIIGCVFFCCRRSVGKCGREPRVRFHA